MFENVERARIVSSPHRVLCACGFVRLVVGFIGFAALSAQLQGATPDGAYDTSWGSGGTVVFSTNATASFRATSVARIIVEPSGRFLVGGPGGHGWYVGERLADGSASPAFGEGDGSGLVDDCFLSSVLCGSETYYELEDLVLLPDSRIAVTDGSILARLTSGAHALDTASVVGNTGYVTMRGIQINDAQGTFDVPVALLSLPSGKWLVAGAGYYSLVRHNAGNLDFAVIRLNADFSLDVTFNAHTDGSGVTFAGGQIVAFDLGGNTDEAAQVLVQSDGRIVLVGNAEDGTGTSVAAIARLNSDGTPDTSYGGGTGKVVPGIPPYTLDYPDFAHSAHVDAADRLLLAVNIHVSGYIDTYMGVLRLLPSGDLDTAFDGDGLSRNEAVDCYTDSNGFQSIAHALTLDSAGRILVAGACILFDGSTQFLVERLRGSDGSLDTNFGNGGFSIGVFAGGGNAQCSDIVMDASGHPVIGGFDDNGSSYQAGMARLTYDLIFTNGYEHVPPGYVAGQQ